MKADEKLSTRTTGAEDRNEWVLLCKRTDDPKLAWIEKQLRARGIETVRKGRSFHADHCLYVPRGKEKEAWDFLAQPAPARLRRWYKTIDEIPDDHPMFGGGYGS